MAIVTQKHSSLLYNISVNKWWGTTLGILVVATCYFCYAILRPLNISNVSINISQPQAKILSSTTLNINRGAVGYINPETDAINCRPLGEGDAYNIPQPTASLAKMITVQVVLDKYPLDAGQGGPIITMSNEDEDRYWREVYNGGSNARVVAGEQISEYQLIQGIVLASANNMADSLAIWAFGSMDGYFEAAKQWLDKNGLSSTTVAGDASGFNPATTSTPTDLCRIMLLAAKQPALTEIMSQSEAVLPTGDVIYSTNRLLGQDGIFGGKTGYTDEAGRGVMIAARHKIDNVDVVTGAVSLSNDSYDIAFETASQLNKALSSDISVYTISSDEPIGHIATKWSGAEAADVSVSHNVNTIYWVDQPPKVRAELYTLHGDRLSNNSVVGRFIIDEQTINLVTPNGLKPAGAWWRLTSPLS